MQVPPPGCMRGGLWRGPPRLGQTREGRRVGSAPERETRLRHINKRPLHRFSRPNPISAPAGISCDPPPGTVAPHGAETDNDVFETRAREIPMFLDGFSCRTRPRAWKNARVFTRTGERFVKLGLRATTWTKIGLAGIPRRKSSRHCTPKPSQQRKSSCCLDAAKTSGFRSMMESLVRPM